MPIATPQGTLDFKSVDTVTFVGASSNTVIDTTTGSLGVGVDGNGPTSNLHVVGHTRLEGDINMLHTSNTASIKLNSNVVTEFPRSKKLIKYPRVAMTGPSAPTGGYTASASIENGVRQAYTAFDGDDTTFWQIVNNPDRYDTSGNATSDATLFEGDNGEWIKILLPDKVKISSIRRRATNSTRRPTNCKLYGSNDDTTWHLLEYITFSNTDWADGNVNTNNYYNYFVLQVLTVSGNGQNVDMKELELYGTPEHDPDADGVDVVVKSVPNVPNTDWLEVYYDAKNYSGSGDVQDESGNDRDAEMNATFDNGEIKAFNFTGAHTSNVTTSDHGLGTGDVTYTVSYWFKRIRKRNTYDYLYIMGNGGSSGEASLMWILNDQLSLDHWSTQTRYNEPIQNNRWYHVAAGHKGGQAVTNDFLFIDGQNVGVSVSTPQTFNLQGSKLTLGTSHNTTDEFLEGSIANFRLFNRALTSDEIYQLYAYQKEYFGHGDLSMTLKAGRLGIGTSEPRAALDVRGDVNADTIRNNNGTLNLEKPKDTDFICGRWTTTMDSSAETNVVTNLGPCMSTQTAQGTGMTGSIGRFTAPHDGYYHAICQVINVTGGTSNLLIVYDAGGTNFATNNPYPGTYSEIIDLRSRENVEQCYNFVHVFHMEKNDFIQFRVHSSGYTDGTDRKMDCSVHLLNRI